MDNELWYCVECDSAGIDDTQGLWSMDEIARFTDTEELWDEDCGIIMPPVCPMHVLNEMQNEHEMVTSIIDYEISGGW